MNAVQMYAARVFIAVALLGAIGCSKQESKPDSEHHGHALKGKDDDRDRVQALQANDGGAERFTANATRACRKLLDTGCLSFADAGLPDASDPVDTCLKLMEIQALAVAEELEEIAEHIDGGVAPSIADLSEQMLTCIELAPDCAARDRCIKGIARPSWSLDGGLVPPGFEAGLPPPPPPWTPPWTGPTTPGWRDVPWDGGVRIIPGVDSPACAKCAIERCPTMAYYCFGASGNATHCPGGDCCQDMRTCIESCGGYRPGASPAEFYDCMERCTVGRPHAPQQLGNLQNCAAVACSGCQTRDISTTRGPDGGLVPIPPVPTNPLHPRLTCVSRIESKNFIAIFGYKNDSATIVNVPVATDNKFSPVPINRGQPTAFLPGRHPQAFAVSFDGKKITWSLNGRNASAAADSPQCDADGGRLPGDDDDDDDQGEDERR